MIGNVPRHELKAVKVPFHSPATHEATAAQAVGAQLALLLPLLLYSVASAPVVVQRVAVDSHHCMPCSTTTSAAVQFNPQVDLSVEVTVLQQSKLGHGGAYLARLL